MESSNTSMKYLFLLLLFPSLCAGQNAASIGRSGVVTTTVIPTPDAKFFSYQNDFAMYSATPSTLRDMFLSVASSGSSVVVGNPSQNDELGIITFSTGTSVNNYVGLYNWSNAFSLATDNSYVLELKNIGIIAPPNTGENYRIRIGFLNSPLGSTGIYFEAHSSNANWQMTTNNGSSGSTTFSSVPISSSANYDLKIEYTSGVAYFYINNALAHSTSANINTSGRLGVAVEINKLSGVSASSFNLDYLSFTANLPGR